MSPRSEQNPALGQQSPWKKHVTLLSSKHEPAIWSCDTGQRISWHDSCQMNVIRMSNIRDICCNPRLHDLVLWMAAMLCDVVVVVARRTRPWSMPLAILTLTKKLHGFLFLCIHVVLFLQLRSSADKHFIIVILHEPILPIAEKRKRRYGEDAEQGCSLYF